MIPQLITYVNTFFVDGYNYWFCAEIVALHRKEARNVNKSQENLCTITKILYNSKKMIDNMAGDMI